jgi:hypothetical protein
MQPLQASPRPPGRPSHLSLLSTEQWLAAARAALLQSKRA